MLTVMLVWADIENEPQVQYLLPLVEACRRQGARTIVTGRDYGSTFELLENRGEDFRAVGSSYGASKTAKVRGLLRRSHALTTLLRQEGVPDRLICCSRAGALTARRLGIQCYVISDYEYVNLTVFRWARSRILYPDVIDSAVYRRAGFSVERLTAFDGLKEDLTFAGVDLDRVDRAALGDETNDGLIRVLLRPPAEESHYYDRRSRQLYLETLDFLARNERSVVVFVPRYPRQIEDLSGLPFVNPPIVLDRPMPFLALLKAVDLVLCSGGTMLREAAYLGIPAYSIFGSHVGGVDKYLQTIGRVSFLSKPEEFDRIKFEKNGALSPLASNPHLVDELAAIVMGPPRPG